MSDQQTTSDEETTVAELRELVRQFVDARRWQPFHSPKNLTMALSIEVSELMEHFQWISTDASRKIGEEPGKLEAVSEELADVVSYALAIANALQIDISSSVRSKMVKNDVKYPAQEYQGRFE